MKISRASVLLFITAALLSVSGCNLVNKVRARNELNDGAKAYKERKFDEAEKRFRTAMELDPNQMVTEKLLARSLHQQFLAKRDSPENIAKGEQAVEIYKKILEQNPNDEVTNSALSSIIELTKGQEALVAWLTQRAGDARVDNNHRASAYTSLASKQYNCANTITEIAKENQVDPKTKTAKYIFKKEKIADRFEEARQCTEKGMKLIDEALKLDQSNDSTWSYKASLLIQAARIAEMENNLPLKDQLTAESNTAKERFKELTAEKARKKEEEERKKKEAEEAEK